MDNEKSGKQVLVTAVAVAWCFAVAAAYYTFNGAYYTEKVSTFGRFFLTLMGL